MQRVEKVQLNASSSEKCKDDDLNHVTSLCCCYGENNMYPKTVEGVKTDGGARLLHGCMHNKGRLHKTNFGSTYISQKAFTNLAMYSTCPRQQEVVEATRNKSAKESKVARSSPRNSNVGFVREGKYS